MEFTDEFKQALSELPDKKKDALILRYLKKDIKLAKKMYCELVDDRSVEEQRETVEARVNERSDDMIRVYNTPGWLMMDMRYLSGEINEHVRLTKDKYGEIQLNLLMLNKVLKGTNFQVAGAQRGRSHKYCMYVLNRAFKLMILLHKMHEDLWLEFEEGFKQLGMLIGQNPVMMQEAMHNGFDVNWLCRFEIPEDVATIQKNLKARGYLK